MAKKRTLLAHVDKRFRTKKAALAYQRKIDRTGRVATAPHKIRGGYIVRSTREKVFLKRNLGSDEHRARAGRHESRSRRLAASVLRKPKGSGERQIDYSNMMYESGKAAAHKESVTGKNPRKIAPNRRAWPGGTSVMTAKRIYGQSVHGKRVLLHDKGEPGIVIGKSMPHYNMVRMVSGEIVEMPASMFTRYKRGQKPKQSLYERGKIKPNRGKHVTDADMEELMRDPEFKKALNLYRKLHGCDPESISRRILPIGGKRVTGREFFVSMGLAPAESYEPHQRGSRKRGKIWVHPYDNKPEKVVSADGKTIVTLPGSHGVRDIDGEAWIDG